MRSLRRRRRGLRLTVFVAVGIAAFAAAGCAGSDAEPAPSNLEHAGGRLPPSYVYDLRATCGERDLLGDFRITVDHNHVRSARPLDGTRMSGLKLEAFPTIADLIQMVEGGAEPEADVDVHVDSEAVLVSVKIDHDPSAIDDEECYRVSNFKELG